MTDREFLDGLDRLRKAGHADVVRLIEAATGESWRRELLRDAAAFYAPAAGGEPMPSGDAEAAARQFLTLRAMAPARDDGERWLRSALSKVGADLSPEARARLDRVHRDLERLAREAPVEASFMRLTGMSLEEVTGVLPTSDRDTVRESGTAAGAVATPSARNRIRRAAVSTVAGLALIASTALWYLGSNPTSPVDFFASEPRFDEGYSFPGPGALRGEVRPGTDMTEPAVEAASRLLRDGWDALRAARRSRPLGRNFFDSADLRAAEDAFRRAGAYARAPADIRGEALYGLAVTAWLQEDLERARALAADTLISWSPAADAARRLRLRLDGAP